MFTVLKDTTRVHFALSGARCSPMHYALRYNTKAPPHRSCHINLAEAIAPFGLTKYDVHDVFNVFMNVDIEDNVPILKPPVVSKDDYIDMKAEMNCLVAMSACPGDLGPVNAGAEIRALKAQIFSQT